MLRSIQSNQNLFVGAKIECGTIKKKNCRVKTPQVKGRQVKSRQAEKLTSEWSMSENSSSEWPMSETSSSEILTRKTHRVKGSMSQKLSDK